MVRETNSLNRKNLLCPQCITVKFLKKRVFSAGLMKTEGSWQQSSGKAQQLLVAREMEFICLVRGRRGASSPKIAQRKASLGSSTRGQDPSRAESGLGLSQSQGPIAQQEPWGWDGGWPWGARKQSPRTFYSSQEPWHSFSCQAV